MVGRTPTIEEQKLSLHAHTRSKTLATAYFMMLFKILPKVSWYQRIDTKYSFHLLLIPFPLMIEKVHMKPAGNAGILHVYCAQGQYYCNVMFYVSRTYFFVSLHHEMRSCNLQDYYNLTLQRFQPLLKNENHTTTRPLY